MIIMVPVAVPAMALGFGVMDEPAGETWSEMPIELSGWAMDPNGIASVEAVVDGGESWPLQHALSGEINKFFPVGQSPVRFHGSITLKPSRRQQVVRIWVTSDSGQRNVIERRWMRQER